MKNFGLLPVAVNATWRRMGLIILMFICGMALARTARGQSIIIDGNPIDWTGKFTDPLYNPKTFVVDRVDALDTGMTGGGSKDDGPISGWQWQAGQVTPAKDNIENAGILKRGDSLFFFIDRVETSGDANYGLWVFKSPVSINPAGGFTGIHTVGDIFVAMTFTQGGGIGTPVVYKWNGTTIVPVTLSPSAAIIATNTTGYPIVWPYTGDSTAGYYKTGSFLEGFVNLDSLGETDLCFTTFMADSRTSQSTSSVIKDIVFGSFATKPTVTVADVSVCKGEDAVFTANVTGGIPPITFSWNGGAFAAANTFTVTAAMTNTVVTVRAQGSNGCISAPDTANLIVKPTPTVTPTPDVAYCPNVLADSIHFSGTGTTYSWTGTIDVGFGKTGTGTIPKFITVNGGSTPRVDTVIVIPTANGCTGPADTFLVTINPNPGPNAPVSNAAICNGNTQPSIDLTSIDPSVIVHWKLSSNLGFGVTGNNVIPSFIGDNGGSAPIVVTVTVTASTSAGCSANDTTAFTLTINPNAAPNAPVANFAICSGTHHDTIDIVGLDVVDTFFWTSTSDIGFGTSGKGKIPAFTATVTPVQIVATVTVTAITPSGCPGETGGFVVTVNPLPVVVAKDTSICAGVSFSLDLLSDPDGGTWSGTGSSGTTFSSAGLSAGPHGLLYTFTDANSCTNSDSAYVTILANPVVVARDTAICAGVSFSLNLLSDPDGGTWSGSGVSGTTFNSTGLSGKIGLFYVFENGAGCSGSDSAYITINPLPTVVARDTSICAGASVNLNLLSDPDGGTWTGNGVSGTTFNSAGLAGVQGLKYAFTDLNGCSNSDSAYITINPLPTVVARDTSICAGASVNLNLLSDPDGGTWTGNGVSGTTFSSSGLSGVQGLKYAFTDLNGCSNSDSAYITINALPTVTARDTSICAGVSFSLNLLSDPDGGTWSGTGSSGTTFSSAGLSLGKHGLLYTFTSGAGCTASDSAYVTITSCGNIFATFTQGFWGSTNGKHCDGAGTQRNAVSLINYLLNLGGPITIGLPGRSVIIPVTAATIVNAVMPGGHTPNKLTVAADVTISNTAGSVFATNYLTGGRINNVFLSQMIALRLGTRIVPGLLGFPIVYNPAGDSKFQTCGTSTTDCANFTVSGGCSCWTLKQSVTNYVTKGGTKAATLADLLAVADSLIGGGIIPGTTVGGYVVPSYADMSDAIDLFNNAFDNFKSFPGSYGCPSPKTPTADAGGDLESAMRIYPNPTTGTFTIEIPAIDKDAHITIVDLNGRTIMSDVISANTYGQSKQVDLPRVAPGLYIIHVENNGQIFSKKIMVE